MDASFGSASDAPTPTPIIPGLDISSLSRVRMTPVARSMEALAGSCAPAERVSGAAAQVTPTKLTELPSAVESFVRTSPIGLAMVVELLPAKNNATGWWQELFETISEPEARPMLKVVLLRSIWWVY